MENKEFKTALSNDMKSFKISLLESIKNELKDFAQVQKDLKKSRKLEFRPKDKSLQSICDEIEKNACKIHRILFYYVWLKHGKKYWANRDIDSYWAYYTSKYNNLSSYPDTYKDKSAWWIENDHKNGKPYTNYGEYAEYELTEFVRVKAAEYELDYLGSFNDFVNK